MNQELDALTRRVHELERTARRWRTGGIAASIGLCAVLVSFAAPVVCDVVTGERLVLRDENGRTRVTLDAYRTESPALAFQDRDGRVRARLGLDAQGQAALSVYDAQGKLAHVHGFAPPSTSAGEGSGVGNGAPKPDAKKPATDPAAAAMAAR